MFHAFAEVQEGARLAHLRDRLKLAARTCPYCGFGEVRELDHHLPRSFYKALSIYATNLIPCCSACNNKKRAHRGEADDEQFTHVYLGQFPAERFLAAEVTIADGCLKVRFSIRRCSGMSESQHRSLNFQFARLDLDSRYQAEVIAFVTEQRSAIEMGAASGEGGVRELMRRTQERYSRDFGPNSWRTALVDGLASSDDFCADGYRHCFGIREHGA
jgi:hypothetical protein